LGQRAGPGRPGGHELPELEPAVPARRRLPRWREERDRQRLRLERCAHRLAHPRPDADARRHGRRHPLQDQAALRVVTAIAVTRLATGRSNRLVAKLRGEDGLGLVELLIALLVLNVGIFATLGAFTSAATAINRASHVSTASAVADKHVETYPAP